MARDNAEHVRRVRASRLARLQADPYDAGHGTIGGYDCGCRCDLCSANRIDRYHASEGARPHLWRVMVTSTYDAARTAWESLRESGAAAPPDVAGTAGSCPAYYQLEDDDFKTAHPPPTFGEVLRGLRGRFTSSEG